MSSPSDVGWVMARIPVALLVLIVACACDLPWAGPAPPSGAVPVAFSELGNGPVAERAGVYAATSIAAVRAAILRDSTRPDPCQRFVPSEDRCWEHVADRTGRLYVAVPNPTVCYRSVKESAALSGSRLYFIFWIGKPQRACNLALAMPSWRLVSFARADLPPTGALTVDLQTQEDGTTQDLTTEIHLS